VIVTVLAAVNLSGMDYYLMPMAERVRSPLHAWLRPSGIIGQSAGILALAIFIFLWLYPLRKRFRWLAFTGAVGRWLDVHITAALTLPLLLTIHAGWRFGGLIGLGFDAMMIVVASGVVGRYLYVRIPRSRNGAELSRDEVQAQRHALLEEIARRTGLEVDTVARTLGLAAAGDPRKAPGPRAGPALVALVRADIDRYRAVRDLRSRWRATASANRGLDRNALDEVVRLARREMSLEQQVRMLDATHRVFRYWHVAHRPIALTALVAVVVHVAVAVALGVTWFW
jgi:hypothetical protein